MHCSLSSLKTFALCSPAYKSFKCNCIIRGKFSIYHMTRAAVYLYKDYFHKPLLMSFTMKKKNMASQQSKLRMHTASDFMQHHICKNFHFSNFQNCTGKDKLKWLCQNYMIRCEFNLAKIMCINIVAVVEKKKVLASSIAEIQPHVVTITHSSHNYHSVMIADPFLITRQTSAHTVSLFRVQFLSKLWKVSTTKVLPFSTE